MTEAARQLLRGVAGALRELSVDGPTDALSLRFVDVVERATPRPVEPTNVAVVDQMTANGPPLRDELLALSATLPWAPSHRVDDGGEGVALLDFGTCLDLGTLTVGAMAVAPNNVYPEHEHPPLEMYLVLGGTAWWRHGGAEHHVERRAGDIVINHPNDRHGVRTGDEALLAVYVLDT